MRRIATKNIGGIAINLVEYNNAETPYGVEANGKPIMLTNSLAEAELKFNDIPKPGFPGNLGKAMARPDETEQPTESETNQMTWSSSGGFAPYNPPTFENTEAWVSEVFIGYVEDVLYPGFWPADEQPKVVEITGIVQTAAPSSNQPAPNQNTYQWHVAYIYELADGSRGPWEEILFYKTKRPYYSFQGQNDSIPVAVSMGRAGNLAVGSSGFTPLEGGVQASPDAVSIIDVGYFGGSTEQPQGYEIELRGSDFYVIKYRPNEYPNVSEVAGPFTTREEAQTEAQAWIAQFTIDVINEEVETERQEYAEAGSSVEDFTDGVFDGDMGTISGNIPDRPKGQNTSLWRSWDGKML